jgi:hypothetical protein
VAFEYSAAGRIVFDCEQAANVEAIIGGHVLSFQLGAGRHIRSVPALAARLANVDALDASFCETMARRTAPTQRYDSLQVTPVARLGAPLRALARDGQDWLAGDEAGVIHRLDEQYREMWRYLCGGAVNSLSCGHGYIVAGCEDCRVSAFDNAGRLLWQREFGLLPETYGLYAGLGQIRRVHVDDLDADGEPEIYVSPDNMHLHALSPDGRERWRMVSLYGPYTNYQAIDLYGEGRRVLAGGMASNTCHSAVQVIDHTGHYVDLYVNDGWTSSLGAVWVGDVDGDGKLEIAAGTNRGWVRLFNARPQPIGRPMPPFYGDVTAKSFDWAEPRDRIRWARHLGEPVRAVTGFAGLIVGSAENGFITAFDPAGGTCWSARASSAATHLLSVAEERCYAFGHEGDVMVLSPEGRVIERAQLGGSPVAVQQTGRGCLVAATDGGLYAF